MKVLFNKLLIFTIVATCWSTLQAWDMPFYTGKIIPTPRNVKYYDEMLALDNTVLILGKEIDSKHIIVTLLRDRIESRGGKISIIDSLTEKIDCSIVIALGNTSLSTKLLQKNKIPTKTQAYTLYSTLNKGKKVVILKGSDIQGLAWAVASFNQLVTKKDGMPVVRKADVRDYPVAKNRGAWLNIPKGSAYKWIHFMLAFKMNYPIFFRLYQLAELPGKKLYWKYPVPENFKTELKKMGNIMNPLKIKWWVGISPIRGKAVDKINLASDKDFELVYSYAAAVAKAGGNIFLLFDDTRFPRNPEEKKVFKSSSKAEVFFVNKFYKRLKKEFPEAQLMFCPVCYWGPAAAPNYPESRDKYLKEVSKINPGVIFTWNGPHVCSSKITAADTQWIQQTIKRKPVTIIFGGGTHIYRWHYVAEPVYAWKKWYYKGFLNDIDGYCLGVDMPNHTTLLITSLDYLWNPEGYSPETSAKIAVGTLVGDGSYHYLKKISKLLGYFDQWGNKATPGAIRNIVQIRKKLQKLKKAYKVCIEKYPMVKKWTGLNYQIKIQTSLLKKLGRLNLKTFAQDVDIVKKCAIKETGLTLGKDIFFSPYDFAGGAAPQQYSFRCEKRLATWIRGKRTRINRMYVGFELADNALSQDKELIICGQDDDSDTKCPIKITVNGNKVYQGPAPFKSFGWYRHSFKIKASWLKEGHNLISIKCLADASSAHGPPFFMLNYAVLKNFSVNK